MQPGQMLATAARAAKIKLQLCIEQKQQPPSHLFHRLTSFTCTRNLSMAIVPSPTMCLISSSNFFLSGWTSSKCFSPLKMGSIMLYHSSIFPRVCCAYVSTCAGYRCSWPLVFSFNPLSSTFCGASWAMYFLAKEMSDLLTLEGFSGLLLVDSPVKSWVFFGLLVLHFLRAGWGSPSFSFSSFPSPSTTRAFGPASKRIRWVSFLSSESSCLVEYETSSYR
mmetsp:Transcript_68784/g.151521  ORF Transcript_68784/g.151521 Transcript_68784/m.151521 type:complete len:221 (+) Transcript_68784:129-791(+)